MGLHLNSLSQEKSQDVFKKMIGSSRSFSKNLFDLALQLKIPQEAQNTKFIQEMKVGILLPNKYGRYMIQDAVYLDHVAKMYKAASKALREQRDYAVAKDKQELALSFDERSARYDRDFKEALETWQLKGAACIKTGQAVENYMAFLSFVMSKNPKYLLIGTLACSMLWPWMANNLNGEVNTANPYKLWFDMYLPKGKQGTTERLVDKHFTIKEQKVALFILCKGLWMETNFFREATGEGLYLNLDDMCENLISLLKI